MTNDRSSEMAELINLLDRHVCREGAFFNLYICQDGPIGAIRVLANRRGYVCFATELLRASLLDYDHLPHTSDSAAVIPIDIDYLKTPDSKIFIIRFEHSESPPVQVLPANTIGWEIQSGCFWVFMITSSWMGIVAFIAAILYWCCS
jgi:hypothetical protein